ncbi:MAG: CoA ester lyase [Chloroflexi bacterium]|nr:CoA ester lyase [Chloroflexota bacterium]
MESLRSLLFVPGSRADMLQKAGDVPADALVPDLEDSVTLAEKASARETVKKALPSLAKRGQRVFVRINGLASGLAGDDLAAVVGPHIDGVCLGKVESAHDIFDLSSMLALREKEQGLPIGAMKVIAWIESAKGVMRAFEIASANPRLVAVAFGAEDFTHDMGIARSAAGEEVRWPRAQVAIAAHASEIYAYDTPTMEYADEKKTEQDALDAKRYGFQGKFAIHPKQAPVLNRVFSPAPAEIKEAKRIVTAFDEAEAKGVGAFSLDNKLIDAPVVKRARHLLEQAQAMEKRAAKR